MDLDSTPIITFIKANERSNLVTLNTLNVLNIFTLLNAELALDDSVRKIISTNEIIAIDPSKTFIKSFTYPSPP